MASSTKSPSVFTTNPLGGTPGKSSGEIRKSVPGGTLLSAYPQDNVHGVDLPDCTGDQEGFGGSVTNLKHSLTGASAVQDHGGRGGKSGKREI